MANTDIIRMANQIAGFFSSYPEPEAVIETHRHIASFWDPRMRAKLRACVEQGGTELSPIVIKAAGSLK